MFLYSIAQVPSERTVKLISSPMPEYGETKSENSTSIHSSDALRKNTRSPIYWASKEDHSNHFSLIKALRKNAMASANDFLSILPVAQNAANCLYMPSKGTLTPSPVRERMHVGPLECKGDHPEIGATRCGVTRSGGEGVVRDLVVNDAFKDGACLAAFGSDFSGSNLLVGLGTHPVFWRSFGTHTSGELSGRGGCLDGYGVIGAQPGVSKKSFVHLRNLAVHLQSSSKQVFSDFTVKVCRYSNENQALHSNFANVKEVHLLLSVCWAACGPYGRSHNPGGSSGGEAALQACAGVPISVASDTGKSMQALGPKSCHAEDISSIFQALHGDKAHLPPLDADAFLTKCNFFYLSSQVGSNAVSPVKPESTEMDCKRCIVLKHLQKFHACLCDLFLRVKNIYQRVSNLLLPILHVKKYDPSDGRNHFHAFVSDIYLIDVRQGVVNIIFKFFIVALNPLRSIQLLSNVLCNKTSRHCFPSEEEPLNIPKTIFKINDIDSFSQTGDVLNELQYGLPIKPAIAIPRISQKMVKPCGHFVASPHNFLPLGNKAFNDCYKNEVCQAQSHSAESQEANDDKAFDSTCLKFEKSNRLLLSSQSRSVGTTSFLNHGKGIKWKFHSKHVCSFLHSIFRKYGKGIKWKFHSKPVCSFLHSIFRKSHKTTDYANCRIISLVFSLKSIELNVDPSQNKSGHSIMGYHSKAYHENTAALCGLDPLLENTNYNYPRMKVNMSKLFISLWLCGKILCHFMFEIISIKRNRGGLKNVSLLRKLVSFILKTKENLKILLSSRQQSFEINRTFCTFYHLMDMFNLRVVHAVLFGDAISDGNLTSRFSSGSTRLQMKFFAFRLQILQTICSSTRKVNKDRYTHSSDQISWARVDICIHGIKKENLAKYSSEVSSLLNLSNPKLSYLIDPSKECIVLDVFRLFGQVSLHTSSNKNSVSINKEVIDNKTHASGWMNFYSEALHLGGSRRMFKSLTRTSNFVMCRVDWYTNNNIILQLANTHKTCGKIVSRDINFSLSSSMPSHIQLKNLLLIQHRCKMDYTAIFPLKCCGTFLVNTKMLEKTKYQFSLIRPELFISTICFYSGDLEIDDNPQPCTDDYWSPLMIFHGYVAHFLSSHHIYRQKADHGNEIRFQSSSYFMSNYTLCFMSVSVVHLEQQHWCLPVLKDDFGHKHPNLPLGYLYQLWPMNQYAFVRIWIIRKLEFMRTWCLFWQPFQLWSFPPLHSYIDLLIAVGSKANSKERNIWNSASALKILAEIQNTPSYYEPVCDAESQVLSKKSTATVALWSKRATLLKFCTGRRSSCVLVFAVMDPIGT